MSTKRPKPIIGATGRKKRWREDKEIERRREGGKVKGGSKKITFHYSAYI